MANNSHIVKSAIIKRAIEEGLYIVKSKGTIRGTAKHFGVSKSTIHRDIKVVLQEADQILYARVQDVIQQNKAERHIRGGEATKLKNEQIAMAEERTPKNDIKKKSNLEHSFQGKRAI